MIYLDYNASTPLDPVVYEAMLPYLRDHYGNPSSSHGPGKRLRDAIEKARAQVASLIGAEPGEIIFTSGGTESNNHVIKSVAFASSSKQEKSGPPAAQEAGGPADETCLTAMPAGPGAAQPGIGSGKHLITSAIEHPAVRNPCKFLEGLGFEVTYVGVDETGCVDPQEMAGEVRPTTILVSIMHSNNEVGTLQDIAEIAAIAREAAVPMHTDAAQSVGKVPIDVRELGVDFLSIAGHKLYGPQGIGALYVRKGVSLSPFMHGAGHQGGRRAGTEPVALIVGLGAAAHAAREHLAAEIDSTAGMGAVAARGSGAIGGSGATGGLSASASPPDDRAADPRANGPGASGSASAFDGGEVQRLRDRLWQGLHSALGHQVVLLGHPTQRLPNTLCVGFRDKLNSEILAKCPDICASMGAACHSGKAERSAALAAMNVPEETAFGAIRFSLGKFTTEREINQAIKQIAAAAS